MTGMIAMFGRGLDKVGRQHEQAEQMTTVKKGHSSGETLWEAVEVLCKHWFLIFLLYLFNGCFWFP